MYGYLLLAIKNIAIPSSFQMSLEIVFDLRESLSNMCLAVHWPDASLSWTKQLEWGFQNKN